MKVKLTEPVLLHAGSESTFMIAEFVEIDFPTAEHQISYYGKVYGYEQPEVELYHDGQWVYDLTENVRLSKDVNGNYD